jgi:hypothetical protein
VEETAYATRTLLETALPHDSAIPQPSAIEQAAARGCVFLLRSNADQGWPQLWHDKDLYTPARVVRAEVIAALSLARADLRVTAAIEGLDVPET